MSVIEGNELKPCKEMYTRGYRGKLYLDLSSHCNHPMCNEGCFDGKGDCPDYVLTKRITKRIRRIASQIEREEK